MGEKSPYVCMSAPKLALRLFGCVLDESPCSFLFLLSSWEAMMMMMMLTKITLMTMMMMKVAMKATAQSFCLRGKQFFPAERSLWYVPTTSKVINQTNHLNHGDDESENCKPGKNCIPIKIVKIVKLLNL